MTKVIGMLVALAMFCAMPAVAFAGSSDNVSSGNTQTGDIDQGAAGGDSTANGGDGGDGDGDGSGGDGGDAGSGDGGDAGNQAAICQQNAGGDATCDIDQSQNFGGDTFVDADGDGVDDDNEGDHDDVEGHGDDDDDDVHGVGGGDVENVTLARTGFDAWVLALIGGVSLAGGLGLLAAQRRGKLSA
jgi:hypothetical protein